MQMMQAYTTRFVPMADAGDLVNLYHLARTALGGGKDGPYERLLWASRQFAASRDGITATGAYKDLCGLLGR